MGFRLWLWTAMVFVTSATGLFAALPGEEKEFGQAKESFNTTLYKRAEGDFADFAKKFPASPHLPEAILLQARSRLEQSNYAGAIELLAASEGVVGAQKDEFVYWQGETRLREGKNDLASALFGRVMTEFPASGRRLDAAVKQAAAKAKLGQWQAIVESLGPTNGVFQTLAATNSGSEVAFQGYLLMSEAQLARSNYAAAEAVLEPLGKRALNPTNAWAWHYLGGRIRLGAGKVQEALDNTTNLMELAVKTGLPALQAETVAFRAEVLEGLGRTNEALLAFTNNLSGNIPAGRQRQALLKTAQLSLDQNRIEDGAVLLERFTKLMPPPVSLDLSLVKLGQLRLHQFLDWLALGGTPNAKTNAPLATNHLQQAQSCFQTVAKDFPKTPWLGEALLDLGWCFWLQDKMSESRQAFQGAVEHLDPGIDRARARFKLGDAQFRDKDYAGAVTNYSAVLKEFGAVPEVRTNLFEPALYQIVRAGLAGGGLAAASNALDQLMVAYPKGFQTDGAVLVFGQQMGGQGSPAKARELFEAFIKQVPDAALRAEIELAIARTYEQENNWAKAGERYDEWLPRFTNHAARAEAMYYRAQALDRAGNETNAYSGFTNFVAEFPKHPLTPYAQWRVADYYYEKGAYRAAENDYQIIGGNWPRTELGYQALLMAGRAAYARQGWNDAAEYFSKLAKETNCPVDLHFQALFAYGDTLMNQDSHDYLNARKVFDTICQQYATNYLAVLATGQKASCLLQLAGTNSELASALEAFCAVTNSPQADAKARSIAKVGMGVVLEKQAEGAPGPEQAAALRWQALNQYVDVLFGTCLKENETGDEYWTRVAGREAVRLAFQMQEWLKVVKICERVAERLPQMAPLLDEQKRKALENLAHPKS
jgi:TolA-binding protein